MPDVVTADLVEGLPRELLAHGVSPYVFTGEDCLEIDSLASLTNLVITVKGAMLGPDYRIKPFTFTHTPNSNRTLATTRQHIGAGWLLHARAFVSTGAPLEGQCFVWLRLIRGLTANGELHGTIGGAYLTANTDLYWPGAQLQN